MEKTQRLATVARKIRRRKLRLTPLSPVIRIFNLKPFQAIATPSHNRIISAHAVRSTNSMNGTRLGNNLPRHLPRLTLLVEAIQTEVTIRIHLESPVHFFGIIGGAELKPIGGSEESKGI